MVVVVFFSSKVASFAGISATKTVTRISSVQLFSWQDQLKDLVFGLQTSNLPSTFRSGIDAKKPPATVVRLAGRKYNSTSSKPSSREYTTRKDVQPFLHITQDGAKGDYNHYRTAALKSTEDRALSILTADVMESLGATYKSYDFQQGDLGENILVEGVTFGFFRVGQRYEFRSTVSTISSDEGTPVGKNEEEDVVVVEITEPIEPCANLCKLPYINDDSLSPKDRIQRCQDFIVHLDQHDGYRGWYAKVIEGGVIKNGAKVAMVRHETDK
jgi:MOSC domain-containing protein YiiM